jgi:proteic killer suppression protein
MIVSITHKGLRLLWEKDDPSKLPSAHVEKIRRVLTALDAAKTVDVFRAIPGYRLHQLTGDLKGFYSITITGNYRVVFRFEDENAHLVNYLDYH